MIYYLFEYLNEQGFPGAGVFQYISFRSSMAIVVSLLISMVFGGNIIRFIRNKQVNETVRDLGLTGQREKEGTPTMGGIIIILSIIVPTLLFAKLDNIYIILLLSSTLLLGGIGFVDDYIKVFKKNKDGLSGKFKIMGQIGIGIFVGFVLYFNEHVVVRHQVVKETIDVTQFEQGDIQRDQRESVSSVSIWEENKSTKTTIPFVKDNEFDYKWFLSWLNQDVLEYTWVVYIAIVILIITAMSNGANMTDGSMVWRLELQRLSVSL